MVGPLLDQGRLLTRADWKPVAVPIALKLNFAWRCFELTAVLVILVDASLIGRLEIVAATLV